MVSIIVPVYNGERYIERCIKNVFMQTYKDWELIVVNDGSADGTHDFLDQRLLQIIRELKVNNSVQVFHKENGGVSSARNLGIENAKGEYIAFIDVDDIIDATYLKNLSKGLGYDMVVTGFCYDDQSQAIKGAIFKDKQEIAQSLNALLNTDDFCFPWARLFKTSIIREHNVRFDTKMRFAEDHVFNWTYMCHISSLYIDNATDYHKIGDEDFEGYNISFDEMEYVDSSLYMLNGKLEKAFSVSLRPSQKTFCHALFMMDYLIAHPCSFYANYYRKYHSEADEYEVYDYIANNIFHPGLQLVKQCRYTYKQMSAFLDEPWKLFKNTKIKSKIYIPFIKILH